MNLQQRTEAFVQLGKIINTYLGNYTNENDINSEILESFSHKINYTIEQAFYQNGWFTKENVLKSLTELAANLNKEELENWLKKYEELKTQKSPKNIGIIMAGIFQWLGFTIC